MRIRSLVVGLCVSLFAAFGALVAQARTMAIESHDEESITLSFDAANETNSLFIAYGATDGGSTRANWDVCKWIKTVYPATTELTIPAPEGWGTTVKKLRFFLTDGTEKPILYDQAIEYIETSGAQWINTGVCSKSTIRTELDFCVSSIGNTGSTCVFGERLDASSGHKYVFWLTKSGALIYPAINFGGYDSGYKTAGESVSTRCKLRNENSDLYLNDTLIADGPAQTFTSDWNMLLFAMAKNAAGTSVDNRTVCSKLWGAKMWDGETPLRDFVPCKVEGVAGLFDEVNAKFYPSITATAFIAGPDCYREPAGVVFAGTSDLVTAVDKPTVIPGGVTAANDGTATIRGEVFFAKGSSGDVIVSYGTAPDALTSTATLATDKQAGDSFVGTLSGLAADTFYYYTLHIRVGGDDLAPSAVCRFLTPAAGATHRTVKILSINENAGGTIESVTLGFSAIIETNNLYCYSGKTDAGSDLSAWENRAFVQLVPPETQTLTVPMPDDWGRGIFALRFALSDGTEKQYPFTAVDYIQTTGAQGIDTGIKPNKTTKVSFKVSHNEQTMDQMLFGVRNYGFNFLLWFNDTAKRGFYQMAPCIGSSVNLTSNAKCWFQNVPLGTVVTIDMGIAVGDSLTPEGGETLQGYTAADFAGQSNNTTSSKTLMLFALWNGNTTLDSRKFVGKFYSGKIWHANALAREFQPCVKDGVAGLWDFVDEKFYPSCTTTALLAGNEIKLEPRVTITYGSQSETVSLGAQPLVSFDEVTANEDGSVEVAWDLVSCGTGSSADIVLLWGAAADSIVNEQMLATAQAVGTGSALVKTFMPDRTYYLKVVARVGEESSEESVMRTVTTASLPTPAVQNFCRSVSVDHENRTGGLVTSHTLAFGASDYGTYALYRAYGSVIGDAGTNGWETVEKVAEVTSATETLDVDVPSGWGTTVRYLRYVLVLDAAACGFESVEYISSLNQNATSPMYIDTGVPLVYGETLLVKWAQAALTGLTAEDKGWGATKKNGNPYGIASGGRRSDNKLQAYFYSGNRNYSPVLNTSALDTETIYLDKATIAANTWIEMTDLSDGSVRTTPQVATPSGVNYSSGNNLHLFKGSHPDFPYPGKKRIYGASLKNDLTGAYVFQYVPVVKDDVACFYDLTSGNFIQNAGSGSFLAGEPYDFLFEATTLVAEDTVLPSVGTFAVGGLELGDSIVVSGSIGAAGGATASVQVEISRTGDFTDAVAWPAATAVAAGGAWSVTIHAGDTAAVGYIQPGVKTYARVRVTSDASGKIDVSSPVAFTTRANSELGAISTKNAGRTLTLTAPIATLGANTTYVWVDWTQGSASGSTEKEVYAFDAAMDPAVLTFAVPDWTAVTCTIHCSNECATVVWDTPVVKSVTANDNATYTWKNDVTEGNWDDPANWTSDNADCIGYPNGAYCKVKFDATTARVNLTKTLTLSSLSLNNKFDLTFAGGYVLTFSGSVTASKTAGWKLQIVEGADIISGTSFEYSPVNGVLVAVRGAGSEFKVNGRFAIAGVSNRLEVAEGGHIWPSGSAFCFGGEASVAEADNGNFWGKTFNPGDVEAYAAVPPKVILGGENASVAVWYGIGSYKNAGSVGADWVFKVPVNGYAAIPVCPSATPSQMFPRQDGTGGWQRLAVAKDSPFLLKGKGKVDHQLVFWDNGIDTNRLELVKLPRKGTWFYTYGTDKTKPLAEPVVEGDLPTGLWARLEASGGLMFIIR